MTFKQFLKEDQNSQEKGIFSHTPGNPALGGKKPSDGRGKNPYLNNQPGQGKAPQTGTPPQ